MIRTNLLTYAVLGAGLAGTWALIALATPRDGDDTVLQVLVRLLWSALPYAVLALTVHRLARTPARQLITLAGAGGIAVSGVAVLYDGLVRHPGPTGTADTVLLPAYQLVLAVGVLLVVAVLTLRRRARTP